MAIDPTMINSSVMPPTYVTVRGMVGLNLFEINITL